MLSGSSGSRRTGRALGVIEVAREISQTKICPESRDSDLPRMQAPLSLNLPCKGLYHKPFLVGLTEEQHQPSNKSKT